MSEAEQQFSLTRAPSMNRRSAKSNPLLSMSIYTGKAPIVFNILEVAAFDQLVDFIKKYGKSVEPKLRDARGAAAAV